MENNAEKPQSLEEGHGEYGEGGGGLTYFALPVSTCEVTVLNRSSPSGVICL
jgi:hypothetical protein